MIYDTLSSLLGLPASLGVFGDILTAVCLVLVFIFVVLFVLEFILSFRKYLM